MQPHIGAVGDYVGRQRNAPSIHNRGAVADPADLSPEGRNAGATKLVITQ